ncbi:D-inositol 3-phosphate glycosyltransferase [bacterium HR40]|nr:D-inositol 3-phosphate glycosyltransferase [bacterium HR40]
MRVAFYAPMKPPDHPIPSGDRQMARAFFDLFAGLGHRPEIACRLRTFDAIGDGDRQRRLERLGERAARLLVARFGRDPAHRPDLWFSYHLYDRAPDPIGWRVAELLDIPYLVAEASLAASRAVGPWAVGHALCLEALARSDAVLALTRRDLAGLRQSLGTDPRLLHFPPFLDLAPFAAAHAARQHHRAATAAAHGVDPARPWLLSVAMMRRRHKLASYRLLASALEALRDLSWHLFVVGDGDAQAAVRSAFAPVASCVTFTGALPSSALPALYAACDLYLWPGFGEAFGMSYLEAQAAGLPVVALATDGVPEVVGDGEGGRLVRAPMPAAFADAVRALLADPAARIELGERGQQRVRRDHGTDAAASRLAQLLEAVTEARHRSAGERGPRPWPGS